MNHPSSNGQIVLKDDKSISLDVDPSGSAMTVQQVLGQVSLIQQIMGAAMKDGEHYGKIPGCGDKPTLLKAGAEKLCLTFRLAPTYKVDERHLDEKGNREYRVTCTLTSQLTNTMIGEGVGTCSTFEAKYRFRGVAAEPTDKPVPRTYWDVRQEDPAKAQELIGGKGFTVKKVEGKGWMIAKGGEKLENDNPADVWNTVLKMGKKRALVDAVLTATAASDIFTQDLEDITANLAEANARRDVASVSASVGGGAAGPVRLSEDEANLVKVPFGSHQGKAFKDLAPGSRAWFFDDWLPQILEARKKGGHIAPGHLRLMDALLVLAPLPSDSSPVQEAEVVPVDGDAAPVQNFGEVRVHFGKNRGITLAELTPQQLHWYENDWMPKKEASGSCGAEDLALIRALKAARQWRASQDQRGE